MIPRERPMVVASLALSIAALGIALWVAADRADLDLELANDAAGPKPPKASLAPEGLSISAGSRSAQVLAVARFVVDVGNARQGEVVGTLTYDEAGSSGVRRVQIIVLPSKAHAVACFDLVAPAATMLSSSFKMTVPTNDGLPNRPDPRFVDPRSQEFANFSMYPWECPVGFRDAAVAAFLVVQLGSGQGPTQTTQARGATNGDVLVFFK